MLFGGADADRDHRPHLQALGARGRGRAGICRSPPATIERITSLTVPPWASLTRFSVGQVGLGDREAPVRADLDVEDGVRGATCPAPTIFEVAPTPRSTWRGPRSTARKPRTISFGLVRRSRSASPSSFRSVGSGRASQGGGEPGLALRLGVEVEEDGGDVDAGDAVDQRVVALADDREAAVAQALDQPQLPERLAAVELLGEDPRRQVAQLLLGAGRRQRGLAHVVVEVEVRVVDPDRPALVEGDEAQLLAEARDQVQARGDVVAELLVGGRRALEDDRRGDVHVGAGALHVEERGVEPGQPVGSHASIFAHGAQAVIGAFIRLCRAVCTLSCRIRRSCEAAHTGRTRGVPTCSSPKRKNPSAESPRASGRGAGDPIAAGPADRGRGESGGAPPVASVGQRPAPASPSANPVGSRKRVIHRCDSLLPVVGAAIALSVGIAPAAASTQHGAPPAHHQTPAGQVPRLPAPLRALRAHRQRRGRPRQGPPERRATGSRSSSAAPSREVVAARTRPNGAFTAALDAARASATTTVRAFGVHDAAHARLRQQGRAT